MTKNRPAVDRWAYVYEIVLPDDARVRRQIVALLDHTNATARRLGANWTGRLVAEVGRERILVVTDGPAQNRRVNRMVETGLRQLKVEFSVTIPLSLEDDITPITRPRRPA